MEVASPRRLRVADLLIPRLVAAIAVVLFLSDCSGPQEPSARLHGGPPARIIWIAVDSLRADHMGAWGYTRDTSPWMDDLAKRSATFDWAMTPAHSTLHSVGGYFSGRPFTQMGGDPNVNRMPDDVVTLAEALSAAGVRCSAYTTNTAIRPDRGYAQGFADYRVISTPGKILAGIDEIAADIHANYKSAQQREFIYIHTMDVHNPYRPPYPYGTMFTKPYAGHAVDEGDLFANERREHARSLAPFWSQQYEVSEEDKDFLIGLYDGAIRYTDTQLPELLASLHWNPKRDLVIITADHGEALFEHGWWGHFASLTPTEIHVPLIMNYNGWEGKRFDAPVGLLDLYPTILDLFAVAHPEGLYGTSLFPALTGGAVPPHDVYSESALQNGASAAIISNDYWYILTGNRSQHQPWHPWPYEEALYHYRDDPQGLKNILSADPKNADDMNARLRKFNTRWKDYTPDQIRGGDERATLGENILKPVTPVIAPTPVVEAGGVWNADVAPTSFTYKVDGLTPYEPLFLEMKYTLDAGRIHIALAPAEFRWPGTGRAQTLWEHICAKPGADQPLAATVVPTTDSVTLVVTLVPGTRARFEAPTLRRMTFKRIEEWPHAPKDDTSNTGLSAEEVQRMKSLGYF